MSVRPRVRRSGWRVYRARRLDGGWGRAWWYAAAYAAPHGVAVYDDAPARGQSASGLRATWVAQVLDRPLVAWLPDARAGGVLLGKLWAHPTRLAAMLAAEEWVRADVRRALPGLERRAPATATDG